MVDTKLLTKILESLVSDTATNHPHPKDSPCFGCQIKQGFWENEAARALATLCATYQVLENENIVLSVFEHILLGIEIGILYARAEQMEENFASPKDK